jgi:signal transduction histidine kinase
MPLAPREPQPQRPLLTRLTQFAASKHGRELILMVVLNLMITLVLVTTGAAQDFLDTYIISNAIGFSIYGTFDLLRLLIGAQVSTLILAPLAIPLGFFIGSKLAAWIGAKDLIAYTAHDPVHQWRLLVGSLMVAIFATGFFVFFWRAESYRADLQTERRRAAEAQQSELSAQLALLQAQIEPHFLFNTLANAQSVIESDPQTAKQILDHLNQYFRVSLGRTRRASSTLADELSVITALLSISALRLGNRLRYSINVPDPLKTAQLPPLLLQPLVENALKHGIDPAVNGGEIRIDIRQESDSLSLRVTDTGVGLNAGSPEGVGLANVRARLNSLYGDRARLALYNHSPHGVVG